MKLPCLLLPLLCASCVQLKYSATTPAGTETFAYNSFGGSAALDTAGGTRLTHNHNKTAGQFFQTVATGITAAGAAYAKHADNALSATQSTNAASVTNTTTKANAALETAKIKATPVITTPEQVVTFPP